MTEPIQPSPKLKADRLEDIEDDPPTDPKIVVDVGRLKSELAKAQEQGSRDAKFTGLAWGAGLIVISVGLAFGGWFKVEASAQEKADKALEQAVKDAGAETDKKLAPIATDVALIKADLANVKDDVADIKAAQRKSGERDEEILRLLKRRDR